MSEFQNIFIFVADSLRYDYIPKSIEKEGTVINTLAPSLHTPVSFSSLITGKSPENHEVRGFGDTLSSKHNTIFDFFENGSFYDNELDPVRNTVLKNCPKAKELGEIDPPFVYIERAMDTHIPYGEMTHGNELLKHQMEDEEVRENTELRKNYKDGCESVEHHFWNHINTLKERELYEDTLIVFTSDHGELLGERINLRERYAHGHPMSKELVEVPTVFLNYDIDKEKMRLIDLPETCLEILDKTNLDEDGRNILEDDPNEGRSIIEGYASYDTKWRYSDNSWRPKNPLNLKKEIFIQDANILINSLKNAEKSSKDVSYEKEESAIVEDIDL